MEPKREAADPHGGGEREEPLAVAGGSRAASCASRRRSRPCASACIGAGRPPFSPCAARFGGNHGLRPDLVGLGGRTAHVAGAAREQEAGLEAVGRRSCGAATLRPPGRARRRRGGGLVPPVTGSPSDMPRAPAARAEAPSLPKALVHRSFGEQPPGARTRTLRKARNSRFGRIPCPAWRAGAARPRRFPRSRDLGSPESLPSRG